MMLEILADKARQRVRQKQSRVSLVQVARAAREAAKPANFPFERALRQPGINFICELKKASPSRGIIAADFPYRQIAQDYEQAGAAAISVLTEPEYFLGRDEYLADISRSVQLPLLRKDFTVSEYQLYEARLLGAAAVLLICALLEPAAIREYLKICDELGLSALVEVHDPYDIDKALGAGARLIGVNNRNLKDFTIDLNNSVQLRRLVPADIIFVAESGIRNSADVRLLQENQVNGILIGEALMLTLDKRAKLQELRGEIS